MPGGVERGEEESREGADLVELEVGVQRDVLVQRTLLHLRDQVAAPSGVLSKSSIVTSAALIHNLQDQHCSSRDQSTIFSS